MCLNSNPRHTKIKDFKLSGPNQGWGERKEGRRRCPIGGWGRVAHGCLQVPTPSVLRRDYHRTLWGPCWGPETSVPKALGPDIKSFESTEQSRHSSDLCVSGITQGNACRQRVSNEGFSSLYHVYSFLHQSQRLSLQLQWHLSKMWQITGVNLDC